MKNVFSILLITSRIILSIVLTLWITGCILWSSLHLIATDHTGDHFDWVWLPYFVPYTLVYFLRITDRWWVIILKILGVIVATIVTMILCLPFIFAGMCVRNLDKIAYRDKTDKAKVIVVTDYGCGAVDSSPASISVSYARQLTPHIFMLGERADTSAIDKAKWKRVDENPHMH